MNNQSVTTKIVNLIRLSDVTSLQANGEVFHAGLLALNEHFQRNRAALCQHRLSGHHRVIEDGMVGRCSAVTWYASAVAVCRRGQRAPGVVLKRGNSRGAKGGRKMEVR